MMDQMDHDGSSGGNTGTPDDITVISRSPLSKFWVFTFNNYMDHMDHMDHILLVLKSECEWYVFQEEIGESGTPHLQGTLKLKERRRMSGMKTLIGNEVHWEITKSIKGSIAYCTKLESRAGKQWVHGIDVPEDVDVEQPRGWQLEVMDIIKDVPNKRTIHWFWEPDGCVGKTTLCKYLVVKHNALMLCGKSNDMFQMLAKFPEKRKLILVDVPRCSSGFVNYGAIEQMKNGLVFSGKYEGAQLVFNCPHVIVFANVYPTVENMSLDRWSIVRIGGACAS
jgi:hypothetical protein